MTQRFNLTNGPNNMALMMSLFDVDLKERITVHFETDGEASFTVGVSGLSREDGSGYLWMIKGYDLSKPKWIPVEAYFDTRNRKGWLKVIE